MTGKIFPESSNIYEDQARVLFEFYRQAAETIVSEEEKLEKEIAVCGETATQLRNEAAKLKTRETLSYIFGGLCFLLGLGVCFINQFLGFLVVVVGFFLIVLAIAKTMKRKRNDAEQQEVTIRIDEFSRAHTAIRRDYRVHKIGVAYVPVAAQIPFEDKSFLVDLSNTSPAQEFQLNTVREGETFSDTINDLGRLLQRIPVVEQSQQVESVATDHYSRSIQEVPYYDYMGDLDRKLKTASYCMENLDRNSVSIPVIFPNSDYARFIADFGTGNVSGHPVIKVFDVEQFNPELSKFESLNKMKKSIEKQSTQFEEVLRRMMGNVAVTVQALTLVKMASTSRLMENSNRFLFQVFKASYNHYSPKLEDVEIDRIRNETFDFQDSVENYKPFALRQSSQVRYDLVADTWVADDGSRTNFPFGMLQIEEEIIAPLVQNLMQENRIERLKIYNGIKDQKIDYLNQWHRDTEDFYGRNRAESQEIINQMRASFSEFVAAYNQLNSYEKTERNMVTSGSLKDSVVSAESGGAEMVSAYELKSKEFRAVQDEFSAYMDRLKEDIDRRAQKFGFVEYFDASLRDGHAKAFAESVTKIHQLDERRKPLLAVNPYYAEISELSPPPSVEDLAHEHFSINLNAMARNAISDLDGQFGALSAN